MTDYGNKDLRAIGKTIFAEWDGGSVKLFAATLAQAAHLAVEDCVMSGRLGSKAFERLKVLVKAFRELTGVDPDNMPFLFVPQDGSCHNI
jgi:hypothetical protein